MPRLSRIVIPGCPDRGVREAWRYAWFSAAAHCQGRDPTGLLDLGAWRERVGRADWTEALRTGLEEADVARLRRCTRTGRPRKATTGQRKDK